MGALSLPAPAATEQLGRQLARVLSRQDSGMVIGLSGELGAGKTTLARALIRALGHSGPVISPSYSLVEPYQFGGRYLYHLDLYRLTDPEELEFLGLRDWDIRRDWLLVEWPERGTGVLPGPDLELTLEYAGSGRRVAIRTGTGRGQQLREMLDDISGG